VDVTLENLQETIKAKALERVKLTVDKAEEIGNRIGVDMQSKIIAGEATPILSRTTIQQKKRRGYSQPETPLFATGDYAARFSGEFVSDSEMWLVNKSHVSPQWSRIIERTKSVLDISKLIQIVKEVLLS